MGTPGRLEIGRVVKPHGIRGEVVVAPVTNRHERFEPGSVHWLPHGETQEESEQRLQVRSARRHQGRWIVDYEDIADRNAAEELRGVVLTGDPIDVLDEGEMWVHELVGSRVVDVSGGSRIDRGEVVEVEVNPAHDLLVLDTGALVPVVFISEFSPDEGSDGVVAVDPPAGLFPESDPS